MSEVKRTNKGDKFHVEYLDTPDISTEYHKNVHRVVKLQNGLTALLISGLEGANYDDMSYKDYEQGGPTVKRVKRDHIWMKAFCGLCVEVGSFSDPPEVLGLAYLLQRMVFKGSEKYEEENGFNEFISLHGGTIDGVTDCEHTRFYFDISEKHLFPALDRFAQFFIGPLMKKDAITREREVIQREFQRSSSSDKNRKEKLLSFFARTGHPSSKFLRSNLITLHNDIDDDKLYEELHKFRKRHYSAHRMMLAVQARLSLDTLEQYVVNFFSDIPRNCLSSDDFTEFKDGVSFDTDAFQNMYYVKTVKNLSQLHVTWVLPSISSYRSKPYKYISYIIEHKGSGSLTSYLRKKMWCVDLFCDIGDNDNDSGCNSMYILFEIIAELTHKGDRDLKGVLDAIFSFINLVKGRHHKKGFMTRFISLKKLILDMPLILEGFFRFFIKHDDVFDICKRMHFYPSRDYINGKHNYFEYDPEAIQKCLNFLMPETANIMCSNDNNVLRIVKQVFKINYTNIPLPKGWLENWKSIEPLPNFHLPLRNEFLINNFSFVPVSAEASKYPVKVYHDCMLEIWWCPKFYWPMCYVNLHIVSSLKHGVKTVAFLQMYCNVLKYLLVEELYPAVTAGFDYNIDINEEAMGIIIQIYGFAEKLPSLLMIIAKHIADSTSISNELFKVIRMQQYMAYYNKFIDPEELIEDMELWILKYRYNTYLQKYHASRHITVESFRDFAKLFTNDLYIQCLVQGNITNDFPINTVQRFIKEINCHPFNHTLQLGVIVIPGGTSYFKFKNINQTDVKSVVTNYYQVGVASTEPSVLVELLLMMMKEPLKNQLRTQEQLGDVSCNIYRDINGMLGYSITVYTQADKYTTESVDQRIDEFLNSFKIMLEQFAEKELDDIKEGLKISKQHDGAEILKDEVNRNWNEITKQQYTFDRCEKEVLALENININELREWFGRHTPNGSNFRKLSVHVVGTDPKKIAANAENRMRKEYCLKEYIIDDSQRKRSCDRRSATDLHITDVPNFKKYHVV